MKVIIITGSTRGIGFGLADAFLTSGCRVVVSGRSSQSVEKAVRQLAEKHSAESILGQPCDVTDFAQTQALWDAAHRQFGRVDVWINNAGLSNQQAKFWKQPADQIEVVVKTNLIGVMNGAKVALAGMLAQGFGALYNMEGLGSDGRKVDGLTLYGTTKYGLRYLNQSLAKEVDGTSVIVGALSPGMVVTDLLLGQNEQSPEEWGKAKRIFNILADKPETVTPWLAQRVLENTRNGASIQWLTQGKIIRRFLTAPFSKRDLFV